ncbi:unnamed protein product, partial [Polarella glacialis]
VTSPQDSPKARRTTTAGDIQISDKEDGDKKKTPKKGGIGGKKVAEVTSKPEKRRDSLDDGMPSASEDDSGVESPKKGKKAPKAKAKSLKIVGEGDLPAEATGISLPETPQDVRGKKRDGSRSPSARSRDRSPKTAKRPHTGDGKKKTKTRRQSSVVPEEPPDIICWAGMYGGMYGTGLRPRYDGNSRLPHLVGKPVTDDLKTPAYVRQAYRNSTVKIGPPYKLSEGGHYQDSPAWSAYAMLDRTLEKADWVRSYSHVMKEKTMKLGPEASIRGVQRSESLPGLGENDPRRQRSRKPTAQPGALSNDDADRTDSRAVSKSPDASEEMDKTEQRALDFAEEAKGEKQKKEKKEKKEKEKDGNEAPKKEKTEAEKREKKEKKEKKEKDEKEDGDKPKKSRSKTKDSKDAEALKEAQGSASESEALRQDSKNTERSESKRSSKKDKKAKAAQEAEEEAAAEEACLIAEEEARLIPTGAATDPFASMPSVGSWFMPIVVDEELEAAKAEDAALKVFLAFIYQRSIETLEAASLAQAEADARARARAAPEVKAEAAQVTLDDDWRPSSAQSNVSLGTQVSSRVGFGVASDLMVRLLETGGMTTSKSSSAGPSRSAHSVVASGASTGQVSREAMDMALTGARQVIASAFASAAAAGLLEASEDLEEALLEASEISGAQE